MTLQASGITAEGNAEGVLINMVPKDGGNLFAGTLSGLYTNKHLASDNLTSSLEARGLTSVNKPLNVYDATATLGGPIKKDKVWFFASAREWGNNYLFAGFYWNKTQGTPFYTPDPSRPANRTQWFESKAARVTWRGDAEAEVQLLRRFPGCVHLPHGDDQLRRRHGARSHPRVSLPADRLLPDGMDRAAHEPPPDGCRVVGHDQSLARVQAAGRDPGHDLDPRADDRRQVQRA